MPLDNIQMEREGKNLFRYRPTIGLLTDWVGTPYHVDILEGIQDSCEELDINCITMVTGRYMSQWSSEKCRNILFDFVSQYNVDGLVITASSIGNIAGYEAMEVLIKSYSQMPVITLGESYPGVPSVSVNNRMGMKHMLNHLIDTHRYTKFAYLGGSPDNHDAKERLSVFKEVLNQNKIEVDPSLIYEGCFRQEDGGEFVSSLWEERKEDMEVIVCANDTMALGVMQALKKKQVSIPEDVAITGFDDDQFSRYSYLSTVHQSFYNQARQALFNLYDMMVGINIDHRSLYEPQLQLRESCGCVGGSSHESHSLKKLSIDPQRINMARQKREERIAQIIRDISPGQRRSSMLKKWISQVYDSFLREVESPEEECFLKEWKKILGWAGEQEAMIKPLQLVLSHFKNYFKDLDCHPQYYLEGVINRAFQMLNEEIHHSLNYKKLLFDYQLEAIDEVGERIFTDLDRDKQLDIIEREFPALGVQGCYISIYMNKNNPLALSQLMMAYDRNSNISMDNIQRTFPTSALLPPGILVDKKRYSLMVHSLFQGYEQIGFAIFDCMDRNWRSYEILRHKISMAFRTSEMFTKIRSYTENLEEQIRERTIELEETNRRLQLEILERKRAEEELQRREAYFRELALLLPTIIIEVDMSLHITFINQAGQEVLGVNDIRHISSDNLMNYVAEEDDEYTMEYLHKILKLRRAAYSEFRLKNVDGGLTTLLSHASPILQKHRITGIRISAMRIKPLLSSVVVPEDLFFEHYSFSPRVKEVLMLLLQGFNTKDIAKKLIISENTVKAHIRALYQEVGVKNRCEFFKVLEEYQVQQFGYQSYTYSLLSKFIKE